MKMVSTLSTFGFIRDSVPHAMDKHFAYWFEAKRSQGFVLKDTPSFDYLLMQYDGNAVNLARETEQALKNHFKTVFDEVQVIVDWEGLTSEDDGKIKLIVRLVVIEAAKYYDLTSVIAVTGGTFKLLREGRLNARQRA